MRTVLLGTDFMYDSNGKLIPIEMNTNVGMDRYMVENYEDVFDLTALSSFIIANKFTKVTYIGGLFLFNDKLKQLCESLNIEYSTYRITRGTTVPYVEDTTEHLIIRSAYDYAAIVDSEYCKSKVSFLKLIQSKDFGHQFAYLDENGTLISNIQTIKDNGNHPNFILKADIPQYDKNDLPKFFKVKNIDELNVVLKNLTPGHFLMEFHYNPNKLHQGNIKSIRSYNILFPPNLNSMTVGQYTKITRQKIDDFSVFDESTFKLSDSDRTKYITTDGGISKPKLIDGDMIEMADETFKSAADLQIGDMVKTIDIANPYGVDIYDMTANFHIDYTTFMSGSTFSVNQVVDKKRVDAMVDYVTLVFTDGTTWEDTSTSSYLILRNNEVRFVVLEDYFDETALQVGDELILIDSSSDNQLVSILKTVVAITKIRTIFSGWEITVDKEHLFLTKSEDSESSYVAIEHNVNCTFGNDCVQDICSKGYICCPPKYTCQTLSNCPSCNMKT